MYAVENTYTCIIIHLIPDFFDFFYFFAVNNFMEPSEGWGEEKKRGNETTVEAKWRSIFQMQTHNWRGSWIKLLHLQIKLLYILTSFSDCFV